MDYVISRHELPEQHLVSLRDRRTRADLPAFFGQAFGELYGSLPSLAAMPAGPPFAIYHSFGDDDVDVEACVPVAHAISTTDAVNGRLLPAMTVASTLHVGRYDGLEGAYDALMAWIGRNGFEPNGPLLERYLNGPGDVSPAEYRTLVEVPVVAKVGAIAR